MSIDDEEENVEYSAQECPYCAIFGHCEHVLLVLDKTFRAAEGGALMGVFNQAWGRLCEDGGDDFDERGPFEALLEIVDACADFSAEWEHEGGPGMSSSFAVYYVDSASGVDAAVSRFVDESS